MPSTQEVGRRSQCGYRHRDTPCPYPHGDTDTSYKSDMETHGDTSYGDTETLHTKSVHRLKPIFMML